MWSLHLNFYLIEWSSRLFLLCVQDRFLFVALVLFMSCVKADFMPVQMHIQTLRGRILETILSLRFFMFQYGVVYKLQITAKDTSLAVHFILSLLYIFQLSNESYMSAKSTKVFPRTVHLANRILPLGNPRGNLRSLGCGLALRSFFVKLWDDYCCGLYFPCIYALHSHNLKR